VSVLAAIPSPSANGVHVGPLFVHAYGLATGSEDRAVRLFSLQTGRQIGAPLGGHEGAVTSLAFSDDGRTLASAGGTSVRLWQGILWTDFQAVQREICRLLGSGLDREDEWPVFAPTIDYEESCA
jgi:WD40 repeat protein